ncbi:TolC family protein, partial [Providencia alcalifaciens]
HMPTVSLDASTSVTNSYQHGSGYNTPYGGSASNSYNGKNSIGLNLSIPLYTGGAVSSQVEQAQYGFQGASEQLESVYRNVIQLVRSSFNNVSSSISSINAYKQVVVSAQSSLDAMEAGYQVGTRTIVDVLTATTALYQAKQNLSNARYDYMINQLNIEFARGTLDEVDSARLNANLG